MAAAELAALKAAVSGGDVAKASSLVASLKARRGRSACTPHAARRTHRGAPAAR